MPSRKHIHVRKGRSTQNINHRVTIRHKRGCGCGGCLVQVVGIVALIALGVTALISELL